MKNYRILKNFCRLYLRKTSVTTFKIMSLNNLSVPLISITTEAEEDDDNSFHTLADALTDVEELDLETGSNKKEKLRKKSKLKIRISDDGATTDLEDIEASDNEDEIKIVKHKSPLSIEDLDLNPATVEETYKIQTRNLKGKRKLRTQASTTTLHNKNYGLVDDIIDSSGFTDMEDFDASDAEFESEVPEISLSPEQFVDNVQICDNLKRNLQLTPSPAITPRNVSDDEKQLKHIKTNLLGALPTYSQMQSLTDTEIIQSDSETEKSSKQKKQKLRRKRRRGSLRNKGGVTDIEDVDLSAEEMKHIPKSLSYDISYEKPSVSVVDAVLKPSSSTLKIVPSCSDDEDLLPKRKIERTRKILNVPMTENEGMTDIEDFDSQSEFDFEYDQTVLNKMLEEMSTYCNSSMQESSNLRERKKFLKLKSFETDFDEYETDGTFTSKSSSDSSEEDSQFGIKFIEQQKKGSNLLTITTDTLVPTDIESIYSSEDEMKSKNDMSVAVVMKMHRENATDSESMSGEDITVEYPEIQLPPPVCNVICFGETKIGEPTVKVMSLDQTTHNYGLEKLEEYSTTDVESMTENEDFLSIPSPVRAPTPELPVLEGGLINTMESLQIASSVAEALTDTEEIILSPRKPKRKSIKKSLIKEYNLIVANTDDVTIKTDVEDLNLSDSEVYKRPTTKNLPLPTVDVNEATDMENIETDDEFWEEEVDIIRALSATPIHMREMSGEVIISKEGSGPFTIKDHQRVNKLIPQQIGTFDHSPMLTDTEEVPFSADDEINIYSRADTATPIELSRELESVSSSRVHSEIVKKVNVNAPEEVMYIKGSGFRETYTDVEEVTVSDEDVKKAGVALNLKDCTVAFGLRRKGEWDASKEKEGPISSKELNEEDAAQQDFHRASDLMGLLTYESVLLTDLNRNTPPNPSHCSVNSEYIHKTTSYTQIDAMLERMLSEVEKQEKIFGLDLDVLEQPDEPCINKLELVPSTDALIEIPIKKSIRVPKTYETVHEIQIANVCDQNNENEKFFNRKIDNTVEKNDITSASNDIVYDLISFEEVEENEPTEDLDTLQGNVNKLLLEVEADEAMALLENISEDDLSERDPYKDLIRFQRAKTASSETLSDIYPDSWDDDPNEEHINDYEPIETANPYEFYEDRSNNDIWYEGTYRNLSIVPEEDEENLSLLGSYSNSLKNYGVKRFEPQGNSSSYFNTSLKETSYDSNSTETTSTDEGEYETEEKIVKAEVKLMVKTTEKGKEAIEIRSVREFMEQAPKSDLASTTKTERASTLPSKLSNKISGFTSKVSNILGNGKKTSRSYTLLNDAENNETKSKTEKPVFTLQRLFIKTPENEGTLLNSKDLSKNRTELVVTPTANYPLKLPENPETGVPLNVDLYANTPFLPCYKSTSNPFTEFTSNPFKDATQIPKGYCDWLPTEEQKQGITTSTRQYLASNEDIPLDSQSNLQSEQTVFSTETKPIIEQTKSLIQSESTAIEPSDALTTKEQEKSQTGKTITATDSQEDSNKIDDKKSKKGFFGTLKTFVGKSFEHSDSESEKSPKKAKKEKKKKKKDKSHSVESPPELPVRPPRKPKLPTPTQERKEFADIPFVEASPNDIPPSEKPPDIPTDVSPAITALSKTESSENMKDRAKEIINDVEMTANQMINDQQKKSPSPRRKMTKITVVDEVKKVFQPVVIEDEVFSITIDPTKKETEKKNRETFTINIDDSIDQIEKEILEKSPILPEEHIVKPVIDFDKPPVRPPRTKDHVYEDIEEPVISRPPDHLESVPEYMQTEDNTETKHVTTDLSKNDFIEEPAEKITDSQKMKRKQIGGIFGFLGKKSSKDVEDSDDESSKQEIIEKQDKELSKEKIKKLKSESDDEDERKKSGLFGIFGKKTKKTDEPSKPQLSEVVLRDMTDTENFLAEEVARYEDSKKLVPTETQSPPLKIKETEKIGQESDIEDEEQKKVGLFGLFGKKTKKDNELIEKEDAKIKKDEILSDVVKVEDKTEKKVEESKKSTPKKSKKDIKAKVESEDEDDKKSGFLGFFTKKSKKEEVDVGKPILDEKVLKDMEDTTNFLNNEVTKYEDVKPVIVKKEIDSMDSKEITKDKISQPVSVTDTVKILDDSVLLNMKETDHFIQTELVNYEDAAKEIVVTEAKDLEKDKEVKAVVSDEEGEKKGSSFFGIFSKKPKKELDKQIKEEEIKAKTVADTTQSNLEAKAESDAEDDKKSGLFGFFSKKTKKESSVDRETSNIPAISETVIKDMSDTNDFLKTEIEHYEGEKLPEKQIDVTEIKKTDAIEKEKSDTKIISGDETAIKTDDAEEKKGFFSFLTKTRKSEEKELKTTPDITKQAILSEEVVEKMESTKNFLLEEVERYEDARPTETITDKTKPVAERKGKQQDSLEATVDKEVKRERRKSGSPFRIFTKKQKSDESAEITKPIISDETLKQMTDTKGFLQEEVTAYHDAKPVEIRKNDAEKEDKKKEKEEHRRSGGFFGLFSKSTSKESEGDGKSESVATEIVEVLTEQVTKPQLSENVLKDMSDSKHFLATEVQHYEDVKFQKSETIEDDIDESSDSKSSGLFNIFSKKDKKDSPKTCRKKHKRQKRSKSTEEKEDKIGFIEKIGRKISGTVAEEKQQVENVEADIRQVHTKIIEESSELEQKADDVVQDGKQELIETTKIAKISIDQTVDEAQRVVSLISQKMDDKSKVVDESVKETIHTGNEKLDGVTNAIESKAEGVAESTLDGAKYISSETGSILKQTAEKIEDAGDKGVKKTTGFLAKFGTKVSSKSEESKDKIAAKSEEIIEQTKDVKEKLVSDIQEKTESIKDDVDTTVKKSGGFLSKFGRKISSGSKSEDTREKTPETGKAQSVDISESKQSKEPVSTEVELRDTKDVSEKKEKRSSGFFSKLGEKITGKSGEISVEVVEAKDKIAEDSKISVKQMQEDIKKDMEVASKTVEGIETELNENGEEITDATISVIGKLQDISSKDVIEKSATDTLDMAKQSLKDTKDSIASEITASSIEIKSKFEDSVEVISQEITKTTAVVSEAPKEIKEGLKSESKIIDGKITEITDAVSEKAQDSKDTVQQKGKDIKETAEETTKKTGGFFSSIGKKFKSTSEETKEKGSDLGETAVDKTKEIADDAKQVAKDSKEKIDEVGKKTGGFFSSFGKKMKSTAEETAEKVSTKTTEVVGETKDASKRLQKDIKEGTNEAKTKSSSFLGSLGKKLKGTVEEAKEKTTDTTQRIAEEIVETKDKAHKTGKDAQQDLKDSLTKTSDSLTETAIATKEKASEITETVSEKATAAKSQAVHAAEMLKEETKVTGEAIVDKITDIKAKTTEKAEDVAKSSSEIAKEEVSKLKEVIENEALKIADKTESIKDKLKKDTEHTIKTTEDYIKSVETETKKSVEDAGIATRNIGSGLEEIGKKDIIETVTNELEKSSTSLKRKAVETQDEIIKTASEKAKPIQEETKKLVDDTKTKIKETGEKTDSLFIAANEKIQATETELKYTKDKTTEKLEAVSKEGAKESFKIHDKFSKSVKGTADSLGEGAKEIKQTTTEKIVKISEAVTDKTKQAGKDAKEGSEEIKLKTGELVDKTGEKIGDLKKKISKTIEHVQDISEEGKTKIRDTSKRVTEEVKDLPEKLSDVTGTLTKTTKDDTQKIGQHVDKIFKAVDVEVQEMEVAKHKATEGVKDGTDASIKKAEGFLGSLSDNVKSSADILKATSSEVADYQKVEQLKSESKQTAQLIKDKISDTTDKITGGVSSLETKVEIDMKTAKEEMKKKSMDTIDKTKKLKEEIKEEIKDASKNAKAEVTDKLSKTSDELIGQSKKVAEKVQKIDHGVPKLLDDKIKATVADVKTKSAAVEDKISVTIEEISGTLDEKVSSVKDATGKIPGESVQKLEKLKDKADKEIKDIEHQLEGTSKQSKSALGSFSENLKEKATSSTGKIEDKTTEVIESGIEKSKAGETKIAQFEKDLKSDAKYLLSSAGEKLKGKSMEIDTQSSNRPSKDLISADASYGTMTRAVSDHTGAGEHLQEEWENAFKISETNIDLSTLPPMEDYVPMKSKVSATKSDSASYVTSPTMQRRSVSQRLPKGERPDLIEVERVSEDISSDEESYVVTEPPEQEETKRKPLFRLESEEDESLEVVTEKRGSVKSNILELGEKKLESMLSDLEQCVISESVVEKVPEARDSDLEVIEQKLRDIDEALGSLEQVDLEMNKNDEKKLRRVERKFERMASEVMDKDIVEAKQKKLSTPEIEEKRESEFQKIVSQLSTEEVSECQKDYSSLWDEHTFSPSDEWDSKTPDSQADAQELPQGCEVVYMGPVTLNKDNLVNKAGIEVDVIPIMRSPCPSPLPKKKTTCKRARSEMGFHSNGRGKIEEDRGSLPDLQRSTGLRGSLMDVIIQMKPDTFLTKGYGGGSTDSLYGSVARSLGSSESLSKGAIMNAVVNWLHKSSPFSSVDNVDRKSLSASLFDDEDSIESSGLFSERSESRAPDIFVSEDEDVIVISERKPRVRREPCTVEQSPLEPSCGQLTAELTPKPKPRTAKSPDEQHIDYHTQKSPVRDDILDVESYTERKKFWESVVATKEEESINVVSKKRMSLYEEPTATEKLILAKKRTSIHEVSSVPPVPKPRHVMQTTQSYTEEVDTKKLVKEREISVESSGSGQTESTKISSIEYSREEPPSKLMSEYQASFQPPSHQVRTQESEETTKGELERTDSLDSELEFSTQNQSCENTGYISDSGDVEQYISDSEIEDRVPQIRERLMSIAVPTTTTPRKTIYERSASLPTEDLYEVSARSAKLRKQYYEQQIKKEMIAEHLMTEAEEEASPECKTLSSLQIEEEEPSGMRSAPEKVGEDEKESSMATVRDLAKTFGATVSVSRKDKVESKMDQKQSIPTEAEVITDTKPASVRDLARSFESQQSSELSDKELKFKPSDDIKKIAKEDSKKRQVGSLETTKEFKSKIPVAVEEKPSSVKDLARSFEKELTVIGGKKVVPVKIDSDVTPKTYKPESDTSTHKLQEIAAVPFAKSELHKETELTPPVKHSSTESDQSSSEIEEALSHPLYKEDSTSKPSDSMEVHVDKSEIEDSEKVTDFEHDATDLETKSLDSLNATEVSPKMSFNTDDNIPEITVTLSGKQRRISEDSDEFYDEKEEIKAITPISEKAESPIHQPEEHIQDTVWEVSVESQPFYERTTDLTTKIETRRASVSEIQPQLVEDKISPTKTISTKTFEDSKKSPDEGIGEDEKLTADELEKISPSNEIDEGFGKEKSTPVDTTSKLTPSDELLRPKSSDTFYEPERDEEFSGSVRDESDLGSEIHQDHSDSFASDRIKSESHSDIEKIILESLHQQHVEPEEAKKIASALIEDIEAEIQRRNETVTDLDEVSTSRYEFKGQVSDYLRQLAEAKGLDEREVELVESVLARRQRELAKLARGDTQASSMEITDEDLKYSGTEVDYSNVLEQQIDQLEAEKSKGVFEGAEHDFQEAKSSVEKVYEEHRMETTAATDFASFEDGTVTAHKSDTLSKTFESVKGERSSCDKSDIIVEEDETILESLSEEQETLKTTKDSAVKETEEIKDEKKSSEKRSSTILSDEEEYVFDKKSKSVEITGDAKTRQEAELLETSSEKTTLLGKYEAELICSEKLDDVSKVTYSKKETETEGIVSKETETKLESVDAKTKMIEGDTEVEISESIEKKHTRVSSSSIMVDHVHEESKVVSSKILGEVIESDLDKLIASGKLTLDKEKGDTMKPIVGSEITITEHEEIKRTFSDESKSSQEESIKSPEDQFSTCSSGRKGDSDTVNKTPEKHEVVLRKTKSHKNGDTSSSSSNLKPDRKSGLDFEAYSSSGESHYHSFELDSGKSRACSSDVEGLIAAGSSEYESALTSQDTSVPSHLTSAEYHTAVSSLSSKESMKSLDSESSGNLASVEVSEASETLVPSTFELDGDIMDSTDQPELDEAFKHCKGQQLGARQSTEISDSELLGVEESLDISEEEEMKPTIDTQSKMKRSHEMTFQPDPKVLVPESPQSESTHEMEERFGTSLDEGSVLSMSLSSTSSAAALRTVIELSRADSERFEGSMTISGTSEQMSLEDLDNFPRGSRESLITHVTSDMATSTPSHLNELPIGSVTITTSTIAENGIQSVSTQVTSETHSPEVAGKRNGCEDTEEPFEPKKKGHRRYDSTSFSPAMISSARAEVERISELAESDKYTTELSMKEVSSDEKKDIDESYETEADQGFHRDLREGRFLDHDSDIELEIKTDSSRPQSQVSKSDSERATDDRPDSELAELAKQSELSVSDPLERPTSPEPCEECEIKDDTPEFSSEAQASVGELEQELTSDIAKTHDVVRESKEAIISERHMSEKRDSHGKLSGTSSEKSSFESEAEAEAAFSMVAHISPAHKVKQICPILEDEDAEKHELETRERAQKEYEKRRAAQIRDLSPTSVPDIKITQHMAPLKDRGFHYPDLELEEKEEAQKSTPETPASNSSKSSEETDQGREYVLEDSNVSIPEEPITESKSEVGTVVEKTLQEAETDSPNSDSFEMLEKPDLIDDFVVIEEVAKEAGEYDTEGKSVRMPSTRYIRKHDEELEEYLVKSAPATTTVMTDLKYYPDGSSSDELGFEFEDSPPQLNQKNQGVSTKSSRDYIYEYDRELEANKKWIEQQFKGDEAAMAAAGYGYEMEFERGPLEDIKEEDVNDFDPTSSRIGSLGSQKESGGSLGSVKDSFSSTPEYDVLAGRKYFTRSGEHDDVSMSSLQEFENLERAMSLENKRCHQGSQDSSSNGSFGKRYYASRSGQGDDVSVSSLKEFEGLEKACIAVHKIEVKAKEEEAMLAQIEEGQESIASESESCETISGTDKKLIPDSDEEDYEKRMFEIDEIIRQAQTNVERFIDLKDGDKTESIGRGDSFEEVSKVPDLDLDAPILRGTTKVQWADTAEDAMVTSTDSLDIKPDKPSHHDSTDSLDQRTTAADVMTASTDSIEFHVQKSKDVMTDSIEVKDERSYMVSSDSLELTTGTNTNFAVLSDSIDEDGSRIGAHDQSTSSTGKDFSSSAREELIAEQSDFKDHRAEYMLGSTDSLDPSSSTATHATYQYESDSVFSGSFTSGGSNTMVSSTDTIDPNTAHAVDLATAVRKVWFDDDSETSGRKYTTEYFDDSSKPYVTEVIEPCEDDEFSHTIHRRVELPPEIRKVTFHGADADQQLRQFIENFGEGEDVQESQEVDADGNVHVKRVVQKRFVVKTDDQPSQGVVKRTYTDSQGTKTIYTQQFGLGEQQDTASAVHSLLTSIAGDTTGEASCTTTSVPKTTTRGSSSAEGAPGSMRAQASRRRQLRYDISLDDQTEVDPREHDWRFNLPKHAEGEEAASREASGQETSQQQRHVADQHQLSEEMKELLKQMEKESKK